MHATWLSLIRNDPSGYDPDNRIPVVLLRLRHSELINFIRQRQRRILILTVFPEKLFFITCNCSRLSDFRSESTSLL
jgi:hypothetical protein